MAVIKTTFELDATALGFADAVFGGLVLTHGDDTAFNWQSEAGSTRRVAEIERIFHEAEGMWLGRWQLTDECTGDTVDTVYVIDSPNIDVEVTGEEDVIGDPQSSFLSFLGDAVKISDRLDMTTPRVRRRGTGAQDTTVEKISRVYMLG